MALNGIMIGTSILSTASLGVPINMGVNITFHIHIIRTITMEPMISDVIAVFFVRFLLYIFPATMVKKPVAKICIITPIMPLCALTVKPCINDTMTVRMKPLRGP